MQARLGVLKTKLKNQIFAHMKVQFSQIHAHSQLDSFIPIDLACKIWSWNSCSDMQSIIAKYIKPKKVCQKN